jgi:hypothetical protein
MYSILMGKTEGKRTLERPRLGWEGILKSVFTW